MTVRYIAGSYQVIGASPDGDSIRFTPTAPDAFAKAGISVRANASGGVQLRLDAIDALETHFTPPHAPKPWQQPATYGEGAASALLGMLGFSNVQRDEQKVVTAATPEATPGYILTGLADKYGRAVAMAYPGKRLGSEPDGSLVYLDVDELRQSVNFQLLAAGMAYPTFYSKLYYDLRDDLAATAVAARNNAAGVWADDVTQSGLTLESREQVTEVLVMLPKIFRRVAEYLALDETGGVSLAGFPAFLETLGDRLYTLPTGQMTHLDTILTVDGQTVRLTLPPEEIVFIEE